MRQLVLRTAAALALGALSVVSVVSIETGSQPDNSPRPLVTGAEYDGWLTDLSNWGRWGSDDEIGALNLITPVKRREAAGLVRDGLSVSLASTAQTEQTIDNPCPISWAMVRMSDMAFSFRYARGR